MNLNRKVKLFLFSTLLSGQMMAQNNIVPFSSLPTVSTCDTAKDRIIGLHWNGSKYINAIMSPSTLLSSIHPGNNTPLYFAKAATTSALTTTYSSGTLTAVSNGRLANQDNVKLSLYDVLLVKNNVSQLQNGLYVIYDTGTTSSTYKMYRDSSYDESSEIYPSQINVLQGTTNGGAYFIQTTPTPTVGVSPIVYISTPAPTNVASSVTFVDVAVSSPLPNSPAYASGSVSGFPGQNATYTATSNGRFPTINGVASFINQKILVSGQSDATKNGDYTLVSTGSAASPYKLQRMSYTASSFYPHLWEVLQGTNKGKIYQQDNKAITNAGIGISDNIAFSDITTSIVGSGQTTVARAGQSYTVSSTAQTITLTGDATGTGTNTIVTTLANSGVSAGTYTLSTITVDAKGRVTSASSGTVGASGWSLTGNSGTTPGTNFIGTTDNQPLVVGTNSVENMRLLTNGNLGIGTSSPTNNLSFGNTAAQKIWIETSDYLTVGKDLTLQAGSTKSTNTVTPAFLPLSQTSRSYYGLAGAPNGNVYATNHIGDIYMQTGGSGTFNALGQTTRNWAGICCALNGNVYASVLGGDIYMQTGGSGNFVTLSQGNKNWDGMCAAPNGDIYVVVFGGDIYKQALGVGNFVALGQGTRNWIGIAASPNGNIYATVNGGDIYMQTGGAGNFAPLGQTSRSWGNITSTPSGDIYACVLGGDIYMQTGGSGTFNALGQTTRNWLAIGGAYNGNVYASPDPGDIYMQTNTTGGTADLNGGNLILSSGQGKSLGTSNIYFQTATTGTVTGTALQPLGTKMTILGNGNVGIATTSPTAKLQIGENGINGSFRYVDGNQGASKVLTSDVSGNATWSISYPTAWSTTTTITIGAVTTAPTKATTVQNDFVRYRTETPVIGSTPSLIRVDYLYSATSATGAAAGSGNYLFTLPGGYSFNSSEYTFYTGTSILSNINLSIYAVNRGAPVGMLNGAGFYDWAIVVPYDATRFRLMPMGGTAPNAWVGSGWYQIDQANKAFSLTFDFFAQ